jgi:hypothetical protein
MGDVTMRALRFLRVVLRAALRVAVFRVFAARFRIGIRAS